MDYLLDTNAATDVVNENPAMATRLAALSPPDRAIMCTIVRGELLFGLACMPAGKRRTALQRKIHDVLAQFPCEPVPPSVADHYADIKANRRRLGLPLDDNDCWIAATAKVLRCTLVSRDADFGRIDGLMLEDWTR